jgi:large subunit ribosomal protein L24
MIRSSKPKKQRFFRFNAPLHVRQHFVHSHIDKSLMKKLNIKKSSVQISRGDTVKVMAGSKKGTSGKVTKVSLKTGRISIDSLTKKNARGKEFNVSISASNVYITDLNLTDKYRAEKLHLARQQKETKAPPKKTEEAKPQTDAAKDEMVWEPKTQQYVKRTVKPVSEVNES